MIDGFIKQLHQKCTDNGFEAQPHFWYKADGAMLLAIVPIQPRDDEPDFWERLREARPLFSEEYRLVYLYLLIRDDTSADDTVVIGAIGSRAEPYFEQNPYELFWHVDLRAGTVTAAPGQPTNIMGTEKIVKEALAEYVGDAAHGVPGIHNAPGGHDTTGGHNTTGGHIIAEEDPRDAHGASPTHLSSQKYLPRQKHVPAAILLGLVNIAVMALMYAQGYAGNEVATALRFGAMEPHRIFVQGEFFRMFMAMFVHFGWMHLFFNMGGLMIFGTRVERYYGTPAFLAIYFFGGLAGSAASLAVGQLLSAQAVAAGASGAIFALVGAVFSYTRRAKRAMDMINNQIVIMYVLLGIIFGAIMPNIDHSAHIGGLVGGAVVGWVVLKVRKRQA